MDSCLQIKTNIKNSCLNVNVNKVTNNLNVKVNTHNGFSSFVRTDVIDHILNVNTSITEKLMGGVRCHRVCSITSERYLIVLPDIIWLSPDELISSEFDIYSNVVWKID